MTMPRGLAIPAPATSRSGRRNLRADTTCIPRPSRHRPRVVATRATPG